LTLVVLAEHGGLSKWSLLLPHVHFAPRRNLGSEAQQPVCIAVHGLRGDFKLQRQRRRVRYVTHAHILQPRFELQNGGSNSSLKRGDRSRKGMNQICKIDQPERWSGSAVALAGIKEDPKVRGDGFGEAAPSFHRETRAGSDPREQPASHPILLPLLVSDY